jgi:hypothetical protein
MTTNESRPLATALTNDGRDPAVLPWEEARKRVAAARFYWLATLHPSGQPHVRPVLAVWVSDALYTTSNPRARKGQNLDRDGRCSVAIASDDMHVVVEGLASKVVDSAVLESVADAYRPKYDWPVTVVGGAFNAPYGAPTAGLPPYQPYEITPATVFALVTTDSLGPSSTRWDF